ncbi:Vegetative incompatibility protein HET-E-1 [Cytospora mali]|uniref:Vegetative incompatibility protein HET-E-1 n=1 Tax=Cytospora mali TaxID=578113 RepID=A0A194VBI9_CYTMA|nr:Vegetative incompatibility protein HET-E-1 [Valsa mali var. pyri (nom. inval.)]
MAFDAHPTSHSNESHLKTMRLIDCSDGNIKLTEHPAREVPKYAILSHTWGPRAEEEEVTFQDLSHSTGKKKTGYEKIRFCAEQARRDGLRYFWVDTCCIDKSNKAELSDAINSMFCWYQHATRCYVYLSDVSDTQQSELTWEAAFRASSWFTRGWTLQGLLAPTLVEFFTKEGRRLGDKRSLEQQIHEITGIAILALQGSALSQFSIKERFQWADQRQTRREEDWAYCLQGIFGITMSHIYGEGREAAIRRLNEDIKKNEECLKHLRSTNPRDDKKRIEQAKGGLLRDSYRWILEHDDFQRWRNDDQSRLLWVKGDPGKGKTMLLCGIIDELEKETQPVANISYFFCQATDSRINSATAILRGLIRAVLPVWKTVPKPILHRESGLAPALEQLDNIRYRMSMRMRTLDKNHPLIIRLETPAAPKGPGGRPPKNPRLHQPRTTRLQDMYSLSPECSRPKLINAGYTNIPDFTHHIRTGLEGEVRRLFFDTEEETNKDRGKAAFEKIEQQALPGAVFVYSDGSQMNGCTAWAYVAFQDGKEITKQHGRMDKAEVFDAEIRGLAEATAWAVATQQTTKATEYYFCIDNTGVIYGTEGRTPVSSQAEFLRAKQQLGKLRVPAKLVWTPGHVDIPGNEAADEYAKFAADESNPNVPTDTFLATIPHAKRIWLSDDTRLEELLGPDGWESFQKLIKDSQVYADPEDPEPASPFTEPGTNVPHTKNKLRGLIYSLVNRNEVLSHHLRKSYNKAGKQLFEDANAWIALSGILTDIIRDPCLKAAYLIINALDECLTGLPELLDLLVNTSAKASSVKWIVSSRNWLTIEEKLGDTTEGVSVSLELNEDSISAAVRTYISYKVDQLAKVKKYDAELQSEVNQYLVTNANGTFLWVGLVCQELARPEVKKRHTWKKLQGFHQDLILCTGG